MSARLLGLGLLLAGLLVYVGVARPAWRAAADTGEEYRKARQQRREALQRLSRAERVHGARAKAVAVVAGSSPGAGLLELRRSVLSSLEGHGVSNVRLRVTAGRAPVAARVSLSGEGGFDEVVGLAGGLVRPGSGLVLDQVRIRPAPVGATLEMEALSLQGRP